MPSGNTHDRITLWTLPVVTAIVGVGTRNSAIALTVGASYLFAGLMFGCDLDIRSRQYQRWLWLRWMWLPYQRLLPHRSMWSHGPIVGSTVRLLYLGVWMMVFGASGCYLGHVLWQWPWMPVQWGQQVWQWFADPASPRSREHQALALWGWVGLEAGSMSHSLSDWTVSAWKRRSRRKVAKSQRSKPRHSNSPSSKA